MKSNHSFFAALLVCSTALFASAGAHAQATIDQNKALAGSVTPGDTPGFPVTLSVPGSYKLTGNLLVPAGVTGITMTVSGITLDMNGFNIVGPNTCSRNDVSMVVTCTVPFAGTRGIASFGAGNVVRNGRVAGFSIGVQFGPGDQLENLFVEQNYEGVISSPGSRAATRALIRSVRSQLNQSYGFNTKDALIQGSSAGSNGGAGFAGARTVVLDSIASGNGGAGVDGSTMNVGRSVAQDNKGGNMLQPISLGGNLDGSTAY